MALSLGLSAAIMNPYSVEMMRAYHAYLALMGLDENCAGYIDYATQLTEVASIAHSGVSSADAGCSDLQTAVIKGLCSSAAEQTRLLIKSKEPLKVVNEDIIPALNIVGEGFEKKTVYLPQLLMSAEAAKSAFAVIKDAMPKAETEGSCKILIATVKGDIHDIGKNIVKLILENYGYAVTDLGKDVSPETLVDAAVAIKADIVGLSALMTTTLGAMEDSIKLLRKEAPWCKIMVGGAVLTPEYAEKIGADAYAKDAMEAVRIAEKLTQNK
jgi:5-methyltetrahydrofolate--homocysteine methyltransferase